MFHIIVLLIYHFLVSMIFCLQSLFVFFIAVIATVREHLESCSTACNSAAASNDNAAAAVVHHSNIYQELIHSASGMLWYGKVQVSVSVGGPRIVVGSHVTNCILF